MRTPNPTTHLVISIIKSVLRIVAGVMLALGHLLQAGVLFIGAEGLGIAEELI